MADEDDDPVVLELPVFVCSGFHGSTTHLALLHNPLRPPWRPYEYSKVQQMRMKPGARKMEVELPVDAKSKNYNDCIEVSDLVCCMGGKRRCMEEVPMRHVICTGFQADQKGDFEIDAGRGGDFAGCWHRERRYGFTLGWMAACLVMLLFTFPRR